MNSIHLLPFDMIHIPDLIRIITIIVILLIASYKDIKSREIANKIWIPPLFIAFILLFYDAYVGDYQLIALQAIISVSIIWFISYLLYKLKIFYGADYKAFVVIAFLLPWQPQVFSTYPYNQLSKFIELESILYFDSTIVLLNDISIYILISVFTITVFVNTIIFSIYYFFENMIYNIRTNNLNITKPLQFTCSRKVSVNELDSVYALILPVDSKNTNKLMQGILFIKNGLNGLHSSFFHDYIEWYKTEKTISQDVDLDSINELYLEEFLEQSDWESTNIKEDEKQIKTILEQDEVWVTPGVPFIVPITLGTISAIIIGNIPFLLLDLI